jgi:signal transduction histidine kinase/CheY-like chemotaxis protein
VIALNQVMGGDGQASPRYTELTTTAAQTLSYYTSDAGYVDAYLFNADGRLIYATRQAADIGQSFTSGNRAQTQLAKVFDRARTLVETEISDFGDYPTPGQPAAFIAAPIFQEGVIVGVAALQIDNGALYRVVTDSAGLGETGETVVGGLEGAGVRLAAPLRLRANAVNQLVTSAEFPLVIDAARGVRATGQSNDYRGVSTVFAKRYLPSLRWGMVVKIDAAEAFAPIGNVRSLIAGVIIVTLLGVIGIAILVARTITAPILSLRQVVRQFSMGHLQMRAPQTGAKDEIGELAGGFNELAAQLQATISGLEDRVRERTQALEDQAVTLREARAAADAANQSKSAFLANMSHELRTPMNAILGFTQLMEREPSLTGRTREYLGIITQSGDHLLSLINDVLEMSRIEAGQTVLNPGPFDLYELVHNVEGLFRLRAEAKNLHLLIERTPEVPQYISSDEGKLRQVLINLIGNALKFTSEGGIGVRVGIHTTDPARLVFEVEDTGDGISEADQKKLFRAFSQTETGIKSQQGTGLGLAIARQFVELLGGQIAVRSVPEQGTVFTFDMTFTQVSGSDISAKHAIKPRVVGIETPMDKHFRILIADDKWENRRLMLEWMNSVGFETREVSNGKEAVDTWESWNPHLIWMDMRMPVMDGYEATRTIKSSIKGQATVIIALTASAFEHERAIVLSAGCDDFVRKPARESVIFEKISEHLGIVFRYENTTPAPAAKPDTAEVLTATTLRALPSELRASLRTAAEEVDIEAANKAVERIRSINPALAIALADLIAAFRFDQLQALLDEIDQ